MPTTSKPPALTVQIEPRGVRKIVVTTDRGQQASGTALLAKILPAVDDINNKLLARGASR